MTEQELQRLREYASIPECIPDAEIEDAFEHSFAIAIIRLNIAKENLIKAVKAAIL